MLPILFAYIHHLAAFSVVGCLVSQHLMLGEPLTHSNARKIATVDMVYGISAGLLVAAGFSRAFLFEKGSAYYFHNAAFLTKISLAALAGLISIVPTLEFLSWRKALKQGLAPEVAPAKLKRVLLCVRVQLVAISVILLMAAAMAKGAGYFGAD